MDNVHIYVYFFCTGDKEEVKKLGIHDRKEVILSRKLIKKILFRMFTMEVQNSVKLKCI